MAEKLVSKDHPFGSKRIPLETNYYETYNRDNVTLVEVRETPIERITPKGSEDPEQSAEYEFEVIIYATGFDAVTGSMTAIDIRGESARTVKSYWANGPRSYLRITSAGLPNLFIANSTAFCNYTVCAEMVVEWISDCISYVLDKNYRSIAPTPQAEQAWVNHVNEMGTHTFLSRANLSWFIGTNIPGKVRAILLYANTATVYRQKCAEVAAKGYKGFTLQ